MAANHIVGRFAQLGAHMPVYNERRMADAASAIAARAVDCKANPNLCEKPADADAPTIPIAIGIW